MKNVTTKTKIAKSADGTFICVGTGEGHKDARVVVLTMGPSVSWNQNSRLQFTLSDAKVVRDELDAIITVLEKANR